MKRLFQRVTVEEWDGLYRPSARHYKDRPLRHRDVYQVLAYVRGPVVDDIEPIGKIRCKPELREKKRKVLIEYARRFGMKVSTRCKRDGWIYVRLVRDAAQPKAEPMPLRLFEAANEDEWKEVPTKRRIA